MSEQLKDIGEFGLIDKIARRAAEFDGKTVTGIGDDAAIIPLYGSKKQLITCDTLVENIHFKNEYISPKDLGYKSLAVNLSDIAAMGGTSRYVFMSLAIPNNTKLEWIDRFLDGFNELCDTYNIQLLGGDTTRSEHNIVITCTLVGEAESEHIKKRSDAQHGDTVLVTGTLGDSGGGLELLMRGKIDYFEYGEDLIKAHNRPFPFCREGAWLGSNSSIHAMIDISDGLVADATHIAKASNMGIQINLEDLPISEKLQEASSDINIDPFEMALSTGEDYRLLFTAAPQSVSELIEMFDKEFGKPLFKVGHMISGEPRTYIFKEGKKLDSYIQGYDHFKS